MRNAYSSLVVLHSHLLQPPQGPSCVIINDSLSLPFTLHPHLPLFASPRVFDHSHFRQGTGFDHSHFRQGTGFAHSHFRQGTGFALLAGLSSSEILRPSLRQPRADAWSPNSFLRTAAGALGGREGPPQGSEARGGLPERHTAWRPREGSGSPRRESSWYC